MLKILETEAAGATRLADAPLRHLAQQATPCVAVAQVLLVDLLRLPPKSHFQTRDSSVPRFPKPRGFLAAWPDLRQPDLSPVSCACDCGGLL